MSVRLPEKVMKTLVFLTGVRDEFERHLRFLGAAVILK